MLRTSKGIRRLSRTEKTNLYVQGYSTVDVHEVEAEEFLQFLDTAKANHEFGASVARHTLEEYRQCRLFLTSDGAAGAALDGDGIISVFKNPGSGERGASAPVLVVAIKEGGRLLDCYDTFLPRYYSHFGFREVARMKWTDTEAPADWSKEAFRDFFGGEPDVVFMAFGGEDPKTAGMRIGSHEALVKSNNYVDSWEEGIAAQRQ